MTAPEPPRGHAAKGAEAPPARAAGPGRNAAIQIWYRSGMRLGFAAERADGSRVGPTKPERPERSQASFDSVVRVPDDETQPVKRGS